MRPDRITKLSDKLTNKERAALTFRYLADMNETDLDRIVATVPRKTYQCLDAEYQAWLNGFFHLASLWAIEHWQIHARKLAAIGGMYILREDGEHEQAEAMAEAHYCWEARLLALDRAIESVCEEHGFDVNAVRRLAGTEPFSPMRADIVPDFDYLVEMQANFSAVADCLQR